MTTRPAEIMGLSEHHGRVAIGGKADLVLFRGRYYSELLSRPQLDRVVLRGGIPVTDELPDYRELDDAIKVPHRKRARILI